MTPGRTAPRRGGTRPRRDPQNGGAVVEFAIVLPIFLSLMFGAIDYGWYFYQKYTLAAAVQGASARRCP